MNMFSAFMYFDPVRLAEIIKHAIKKCMLAHPYQRSIVRPHQDVGIIAAYHTLCPDDIGYLIDLACLVRP
jgi:hypothetical protein